MDQDRREAAAWAKEWYIKRKNRRIIYALCILAGIALIGYITSFTVIHMQRSTFSSAEEMRKALQGRYAVEHNYEDIVIDGDDIILTYLEMSHYDRGYAERFGYDYNNEDTVYEDTVKAWDYRHGIIRTGWMGNIIVDKNGDLRRSSSWIFYKTDEPRPEPIDPSSLKNPNGSKDAEIPEAEQEAIDEIKDDLEDTEYAASEAGVEKTPQDDETEEQTDEQA